MNMQRKATRPVCAIALASALALALSAPATALAADPTASGSADATAAAPATSTITGTIHATTLKVTVPTTVPFDIDPGAAQGTKAAAPGQKRGQYTSPANYTIKNWSAVDVYGYVSSVTVQNATLVNATGQLAKTAGSSSAADVKVMVGLSNSDADMDHTKPAHWLTTDVADADGKRYFAFNKTDKGKLAASADAASATPAAGGAATMHIYGAVKNGGWAENESFTVKPVFKVTATKPS